jgi:hypothetical protein
MRERVKTIHMVGLFNNIYDIKMFKAYMIWLSKSMFTEIIFWGFMCEYHPGSPL